MKKYFYLIVGSDDTLNSLSFYAIVSEIDYLETLQKSEIIEVFKKHKYKIDLTRHKHIGVSRIKNDQMINIRERDVLKVHDNVRF